MTDYFALLDQPRKPWLDPDELKQAFHAKSLSAHPDTQPNDAASDGGSDAAFTELNEAYQILQDPKRRIHHLLSLADRTSSDRQTSVPADIEQLFSAVAGVTREADELAQKCEAATTPLSRSLLKPQILQLQNAIGGRIQQLSELHDVGIVELRRLSAKDVLEEADWTKLQALYLRFSYLTRWIAELQEKLSRVATA